MELRYREYAEPLCGPTVTRLTRSGRGEVEEARVSVFLPGGGGRAGGNTGAKSRVMYVCTARGGMMQYGNVHEDADCRRVSWRRA